MHVCKYLDEPVILPYENVKWKKMYIQITVKQLNTTVFGKKIIKKVLQVLSSKCNIHFGFADDC